MSRFRCRFCGGFSFSGLHPACEKAMEAIRKQQEELVIMYPGEEQSVTVTRSELEQARLRAKEEDEL